MRTPRDRTRTVALALALAASAAGAAHAQQGEAAKADDLGWSDQAELSYVQTFGNSEAGTLGLKNVLARKWERSTFTLKAGAVRAEATTFSRTAVGTPSSFFVIDTEDSELTAETYLLNGRYDRKLSERLFWYAGAGWDRNRFAGIQNRYVGEGGLGHQWIDREDLKFKTSYGVTYTDQEDVVEIPGADGSFVGLRLSWDYLHKFGAVTTYTNTLVVDDNLEETDDWRADMVNSVAVAMSGRLALKTSLQWLYDNQPSFGSVALVDSLGVPTGATVPVELDELDTVFTTSLVVTF